MTNMAKYDEEYQNAEAPKYGLIPAGKYQAWIEKAYIDYPEWSEHPQLKLECRIMSGDYHGKVLFVQQSFDPGFIQYLKATIEAMELDPEVKSASEIEDRCVEMLYRVMEIRVVHKPNKKDPSTPHVNCYVQRYIGMRDELMGADGDPELDELPF
jgi:hypothetical protein